MADGTYVEYNGVGLFDCQTLQFEQAVVYDESNTDAMFSRFTIRVACAVHAEAVQGRYGVSVSGLSAGMPAAAWMRRVQELLSHPRANFTYQVGDTALVFAIAAPGSLYSDCDNGPKPTDVTITEVVGRKMYRIEFGIVVCQVLCTGQGDAPPPYSAGAYRDRNVLNNRWSLSEERDANFLLHRTVTGTLRTAHIIKSPHAFRYLALPPLQDGFQRKSMRFWDEADGLTLHYQIEDQQRLAAPPPPAIDWYATYTESAVNQGMLQFGEMRVVLEGAPETDKRDLLTAALKVVLCRLTGLRRAGDNPEAESVVLRNLAIVEHLHVNRIEATALVQHNTIEEKYLGLRVERIGDDLSVNKTLFPTYDRNKWPNPHPYDSATPASLFAKYWQDSCNSTKGIPAFTVVTPSNPAKQPRAQHPISPSQGEPEIIPPGGPLPPAQQTASSQLQHGKYPYTHYEIDTEYVTDEGVAMLPLSSSLTAEIHPASVTAVALKMHAGCTTKLVSIHGERIGTWPAFSQPVATFRDRNGVDNYLLNWKLIPAQPVLMADGRTREYSAQLLLAYGMSRPVLLYDQLWVGDDPRITNTDVERYLNVSAVLSRGNP